MNLSIEQMQYLADRGLSIAEVIEFARLTPDRSPAAKRQARYRAKQKAEAEGVTSDVTRDGDSDVTDPSLSPSPFLSPQTPQTNPRPHTHPDIKTRARKGHRLPDEWQPAPLSKDLAAATAAWPSGAIERELARFRDWAASATGPNAVKSNWDAAWRNWLRKADDDGRYRNGGSIRQGGSSGADRRSGLARAIDGELRLVSAFP